jgi:hypothetical protein
MIRVDRRPKGVVSRGKPVGRQSPAEQLTGARSSSDPSPLREPLVEEQSRSPSVAPSPIRFFFVEGRGAFPLDLLRQEQCWPARHLDALSLSQPIGTDRDMIRQVVLATANPQAPSLRRWKRTGWMLLL